MIHSLIHPHLKEMACKDQEINFISLAFDLQAHANNDIHPILSR